MEKRGIYVNRELSWLKFNERVLEEAADSRVPLCERLFFLSIYQSNLEEFYMVRVGTLQDQTLLHAEVRENKTNMTSEEQIEAIVEETKRLAKKRDEVYDKLRKEITTYGIREMHYADLSVEQAMFVETYFDTEVAPLLSPMIVGKKQSFPFMSNESIYAVVVMETTKGKEKIGIIPCGSAGIERVVTLPGDGKNFMLVEEIILHFVNKTFPRYQIKAKSLVKLTRNADINVDTINDEDLNYKDAMAEAIRRRRKLAPVKLEMTRTLDMRVIRVLCQNLGLDSSRVFLSKVPLNTDFVSKIRDSLREHTELFFPKHTPAWPSCVTKGESIMQQVEEHDVLLNYPYESIKPFLRMLREAAEDDSVISIKMTLYRLAKNSQVVETLIDAVENGKEVIVLVELKARFDEENNIKYARELEEAGCQVIYGIDRVKVHSKLCLITKKAEHGLKYISQIGTGNYNEKTAELYTDLTMMTANELLGKEVAELFKEIGMSEMATPKDLLLVAPNGLQNRLLSLMDEQIHLAIQGEEAYIAAKLNSLTDKKLMKKLADASKAGVKIDLIVRGICCLKPGVRGETDNIRIISIVGRYLEHSRIYIFGKDCEKIYIGSADWMTRNTRKRIEVAVPIFDEHIKKQICSMFTLMLNDKVKARKMESNGKYTRIKKNDTSMASQDFLCMNPNGLY